MATKDKETIKEVKKALNLPPDADNVQMFVQIGKLQAYSPHNEPKSIAENVCVTTGLDDTLSP